MLRLHQTFGAHAGRVREIDRDVVRFGRLPTNDFAFDAHADLDASGNHAEIRREGGRWVLVDVGSRNGTLVDGRPVQRYVLEGGEEIEFGTGGPRVRVEIVQGGRGMPTAPATPALPEVSPQAPTALAPAVGLVGSPPLVPPSAIPPSAPPPPGPVPPHPVSPSALPPGVVPTPAWPAPASTPSPAPIGSGSPKLYGQRTMEQIVQSAVSQAQAQGSGPGAMLEGSGKPHDTAFIRRVAEDAASRRSRVTMFVLAVVLVLFLLTLCGVSGIIAILWAQTH